LYMLTNPKRYFDLIVVADRVVLLTFILLFECFLKLCPIVVQLCF
jgi:hypothetical protein